MEWLINRRRMMFNRVVPPEYLTFEDAEFWRILCCYYGDYNETVITNNGDNTVDIITSFVSKNYYTEKKRMVINTQIGVDNSSETYTAGTTREAVGITQAQCDAILVLTPVDNTYYNTYGKIFYTNTLIRSLNDLGKLRNLTTINGSYIGKGENSGFSNCTNVSSVTLPTTLTTLNDCCFRKCNLITQIDITNVKRIGHYALQGLPIISYVYSEGFTYLGNYNGNASCLYKDFPSTITNIGRNSITHTGEIVVCRAITPPTLGTLNTYASVYYVPSASIDAYKAASNWSDVANKIQAIEGTWYETHRSLEPTT